MPRVENAITAEDLADRLGGQRYGRGWRCLCPAHDDHTPSLDITEGEDGKILVKCRAGCEQAIVIDELRSRGLWSVCSSGGNGAAAPSRATGDAVLVDVIPAGASALDIEAVLMGCRAVQRRGGKLVVVTREKNGPDIVHDVVDIVRFDVKDQAGQLLYVEARILYGWQPDKERPDKTHRPITLWRRSDGQLEWRVKGYRKPGPLYGLEMLDEDPGALVVIHEGPGKADRGRQLAPQYYHLALMGGTSQVPHTDWSVLKDRRAVTWFDADAPGDKATAQAHGLIAAVGARKIGRVTAPAEVPKGWGIDDLTDQETASDKVDVLITDALESAEAPGSGDAENRKRDTRMVPGELVPIVGVKASSNRAGTANELSADQIKAVIAAVVNEFNQKYAVVNEAGKAVVYCPKRDEQLKRNTIERILFEDLRRMYVNKRIPAGISKKGNVIYQDMARVWLEHNDRRQFIGGVVMDPTNKAPADCWNLWRSFAVEPRPGNWSLMRDHLRDVICGGDAGLFAYVMGWLARMVQHPDQPGEVALVLRGKKGTGKGTLGNWLIKLLGQHGVHIAHAKHLVGNFNAHLRDAVFVFADEAFFAGDKQHEGVLKALVTEPSITIEAKYQNAVMMANMTHILMASNSDWVVPATTDERRFCVMDVSDSRIGDRDYFTRLNAQMEAGGLAAMLHDLLNHDLSGFDVRQVPWTEALDAQKRLSLDSLHRWWLTVLHRGFVYRSRHGATIFVEWQGFVATELLHRSYQQWCAENRESWPMSREQLGVMLNGLYKSCRPRGFHPVYEIEVIDPGEKKPAVLQERPYGYRVGSLHQARADFIEETKIPVDWGSDDEADEWAFHD